MMKMSLDAWIDVIIFLGYLYKSVYASSGTGSILKTDQKHRTQKAAEKANELFCYACETMDINQNFCMNVTRNDTELHKKCDEDKRICTVKRVSFLSIGENATMGHKTWSLARSCSDRCEPGCIVIGERNKIFVCWTCCESSYCNEGRGSANFLTPSYPFWPIVFTFIYLLY